MPAPRFRSRSAKRVQVRTPGGRRTTNYRRARASFSQCASCGARLNGVPQINAAQAAKLSKTERRPERVFGGYMCGACTRERIRSEARKTL